VSERTTIVVGSGSSGGVVASRLSEDANERVILIEAGPDYATPDELPEHLRDPFNPQFTGHDWGLLGHMLEPVTERDPVPYPRGRITGGSSSVNGLIAQRGVRQDYDGWAAAGMTDWSWERVLPALQRLENDHDFGDADYHGDSGPVPIIRLPREEWPPALRAFADVCAQRGFPESRDLNDPDATGIGAVPRNQLGDRRGGTLLTYLRKARERPNLEIRADTLVHRVLVENGRAVGVLGEHGGEVSEILGDRVVVCAGVLKSPQILMLSGIGPAQELERLGVELVLDAPGVGRRLIDHPHAPVLARVVDDADPLCGFRCELKYSSVGGTYNDMTILPCLMKPDSLNFDVPEDDKALLMLSVLLGTPRSEGWLRVASSDPSVPPDVHLNFLSRPLDVQRMMEGIRLAYELATTSPLSDEIRELVFPGPEDVAEDASLEAWLRANVSTGFHGVGTVPMGRDGDPNAVLDQRLAVRGIDALYVADASSMPEITTAFTNIPCFMIGERMAEFLKSDVAVGEDRAVVR
jgi:choline dehydrogenase